MSFEHVKKLDQFWSGSTMVEGLGVYWLENNGHFKYWLENNKQKYYWSENNEGLKYKE